MVVVDGFVVVVIGAVVVVVDGFVVVVIGAVVVVVFVGLVGWVVVVDFMVGFTSTTSSHRPHVLVTLPFTWPADLSSKNQKRILPP